MKGTIVASRYAKSLLDLSIERNSLDQINTDMVQLSEVCEESKDLRNLLKNPTVNVSKKIEVFKALFNGKMDDLSLSFIELITKNSRENILPEIAKSFINLYKTHNNILDVILISAQPLEESAKQKVIDKIKATFEGKIELIEKIDPALIGGFIIKIGDKQIDSSVASQLTNLKNILLN